MSFRMTNKQIENFWKKVSVGGANECWIWVAGDNGEGYGRFRVGEKKYSAHRISFFIKNGRFPLNEVLHECDNPLCVNPSHLSDGTHSKNIKDAYKRGLIIPSRGERNGMHKLTIEQVKQIKEINLSQRKIAKIFGVCQRTVCAIKKGYLWQGALGEK